MFLKYSSRAALKEARKRRLEDRPQLFPDCPNCLYREDSLQWKYTASKVYFKRHNILGKAAVPVVTWRIKRLQLGQDGQNI